MQRQERDRTGRRSLVKVLTIASGALAVVALLFLALSAYLWSLSERLPDLESDPELFEVAETSVVYAADGTVLAEWYDEQDRTVIAGTAIPPTLKRAVVAIEDRRFYEHRGVDVQGIVRAALVNSGAGEIRQGGSTITQQTVKSLHTGGERTLSRKIEEAMLALSLETHADKEDILGVYLNTVYYGRGAYGVESAARRFFGISATDLDLAQSALLAGCIQSPTLYDPFVNAGPALERRNLVLREMRDQGYLTAAEALTASASPIELKQAEREAPFAPYFLEYVRRDLLDRLGSERLYQGGLRIYTTLDPVAQRAAEAAAAEALPDVTDPEVAVASIRWRDGAVVAIVGGRDFARGQFDLATQGRRQTGSAFKPFVLAAALEQGVSLDSKWDASPFSTPVKDGVWRVENYENNISKGDYSLKTATVWSINTVYARLIMTVGVDAVVDVAHRMGITTPIEPNPAIALGGLERGVSPLEMASAFGTIANRGVAVPPSGIDRVTDDAGAIVYVPDRSGTLAIAPEVAGKLSDVLGEVYSRGTGKGADFGQWGAVKTGTAQSWRDAWIVGFSGDLSTAVWVGYPDAQVAMDDVHGIKVTGGSFPAQVWKGFMRVASRSESPTPAADTESWGPAQETYILCTQSLKRATPLCPEPMELLLPVGTVPQELCALEH